jgi:Xaa-Pro aminopeptidase
MKTYTRVAVVALALSAWTAAVSAGPLQDDLRARRGRVMERLGPESLLIVWGEPSGENDPSAANLYYLTGTTQSDSILVTLRDAGEIIHGLRQVKTAFEQGILRRSVSISNEAHMAGMGAAAPGRYEYEVESAIEAVYLKNGAMKPGYESIVGSGPNGTVLHYRESGRKMEAGDLLLVDAAGSYQGYTGDITRTYPINGTFTPAQREIYEIVLAAQEAGIKAAKAGSRTSDITAACADVIKKGLLRLGLITDASGDQYRVWATHGPVHWIGLHVHDVGVTNVLAPGMAFVIEPGIYVREQALETMPATKENLAFIEKVRPVVKKYLNTGVRIEDSFLLTATGLERLSAPVPRTIAEIESYLRAQSPRTSPSGVSGSAR